MDAVDWRAQFQPDSRQGEINAVTGAFNMLYYPGDEDELLEIQKIAESFERKAYAAATSQSDYLEKLSSKLSLIEGHYRELDLQIFLLWPQVKELCQQLSNAIKYMKTFPQPPNSDLLENSEAILDSMMIFLALPTRRMWPHFKAKLQFWSEEISNLMNTMRSNAAQ